MTDNQTMDYYVRPQHLYSCSRTCTRSGLCRRLSRLVAFHICYLLSVTIFLVLLFKGSLSLSRPFLSYLDFACHPFSVQLLVHAHLVCSSSPTLSSICEYLVLVDGGCLNALLPIDSIPSNLDHLF